MAATSQPLATEVAVDILKAGGSAVDAAIAANAMLGLVEPTGGGIGGDLFAIVWDAERRELIGLNASGRSPRSLTLQHFREQGLQQIPYLGPLPVSVPGAVDGWFELHTRFGRLPMAVLLEPAIARAEQGFALTPVIAKLWQQDIALRTAFPGNRELYMPGGKAPAAGDIFRNPALAASYRMLAAEGREIFYKGEIAQQIAAYVVAQGGFLEAADLALHRSEWVVPVSSNYRGFEVHELPPNGQGIVALQMLNILEGYDLRGMGFGSPEYLHLLIEAKKLAYEDRAKFYADPDFYAAPIDMLLSKKYAARRRALIDSKRAAERYPAGDAALEKGDTVYLTTADEHGNMVSLIQSNYGDFGSGMTPAALGFQLQNRGQLFSLVDGHANVYAPGKRPFHTIIPAFVMKDGKPWMSFGVMGGAMQPQAHAQIIANLVDFDMHLQQAGDAPRMRHVGSTQPTDEVMSDGGQIYLENDISESVCQTLASMGHTIGSGSVSFGGYQAIRCDAAQGVYIGASESRKDGHAAGY